MEGCQNVTSSCLWMTGPRIIIDLSSALKKNKQKNCTSVLAKLFSVITFKKMLIASKKNQLKGSYSVTFSTLSSVWNLKDVPGPASI